MDWTLAQIIVAGLAVARITSLIVFDDIVEPIRHRIFLWSAPSADLGLGEIYTRDPGFVGRLIGCYHCVGVWVAALSYSFVASLPEVAWPILIVAAIAQINDSTIKVSRG